MTTGPEWRTIARDDLSVGCVGSWVARLPSAWGWRWHGPTAASSCWTGRLLLMQLGSLATIAGAAPRNLVHFLFKNGVYHTSGAQGFRAG